MNLKLQLVRDGEIILEIPLSPMDWPKEQLETENLRFGDDTQPEDIIDRLSLDKIKNLRAPFSSYSISSE